MIDRVEDYRMLTGENVDEDHPHGDLDRIEIKGETTYSFGGDPKAANIPLRGEDVAWLLECVYARMWCVGSIDKSSIGVWPYLNFSRRVNHEQVRLLVSHFNDVIGYPYGSIFLCRELDLDYCSPFGGAVDKRGEAEWDSFFCVPQNPGRPEEIPAPSWSGTGRDPIEYAPIYAMLRTLADGESPAALLGNIPGDQPNFSLSISYVGEQINTGDPNHQHTFPTLSSDLIVGVDLTYYHDTGFWESSRVSRVATVTVSFLKDISPFVDRVNFVMGLSIDSSSSKFAPERYLYTGVARVAVSGDYTIGQDGTIQFVFTEDDIRQAIRDAYHLDEYTSIEDFIADGVDGNRSISVRISYVNPVIHFNEAITTVV